MKNNIAIRRVNDGNVESFIDLLNELVRYEKLPIPDKKTISRLKKDCLSSTPKFEGFLAYINDKPAGYMIVLMTYSSFLALPTFHIEDIFVLEEHRKKGMGKVLFDHAKSLANKRGCGRIEWSVLDWNIPAIKFYEKHDAKHLKDRRLYRVTLV